MWLIVPLLAALTLAVFWPVRGHDFIVLDDDAYVYGNPHVTTGLTIANLRWALTAMEAHNWHPLTWVSHMTDVALFGLDPAGHHLTNLLFHLANTILLFLLLRKMTRREWCSATVAALFAVHPLHVESVAWVAERKDVLSTLFMLLTIWAYARYAEKPGIRRYAMVFVLYALGLMSKPMLVSLPFLLLLLDYWPLGRIKAAGHVSWQIVREKLPLVLLAIGSSVITIIAQQSQGALVELAGYPLGLRTANAIVSYARYLGKTIWPAGLLLPYPYPDGGFPLWQVAGACLLLAVVTVAALRLASRMPYLPVGWLWYLLSLAPVIGIVQVGGQAMADRYTYTTIIGIFILIVWAAADFLQRVTDTGSDARQARSARHLAPATLAVVVIALLAVRAREQVGIWRDGVTLFTRTVALSPDNYLAHNHLGVSYDRAGDPGRAAGEFRKALVFAPDYALAHYNLGRVLMEANRAGEAVAEFRQAIRLSPGYYRTYHNLGYALARLGRLDEALAAYREAVRLAPQSGETHFNLAVVFYGKQLYADAWSEIRLARQYGSPLPSEFLQALSAKMPEPGIGIQK